MNPVITILVLMSSYALCEMDLCRNPKLDSITYVDARNMWFFTSGGYYWFLKEDSFPPTINNSRGKLPNGFVKGEAVVFVNTMKFCDKHSVDSKQINSEKLILLMERNGTENKIMEFDIRLFEWTEPHSISDDHFLGRIKIDDISKEVEVLFGYRQSEIYAVQGNHYSAVKWNNLCKNPNDFADNLGNPQDRDHLGSSRGAFDAIAIKDHKMYQFIGTSFWVSDINENESQNGKISVIKGNERQISEDFFRYTDCPNLTTTTTTVSTVETITTTVTTIPTTDTNGTSIHSDPLQDNSNADSEGVSKDFAHFTFTFFVVIVIIILIFSSVIVYSFGRKSSPAPQFEEDVINKLRPKSPKTSTTASPSPNIRPMTTTKTPNPKPMPKSTKTTPNKSIATKK